MEKRQEERKRYLREVNRKKLSEPTMYAQRCKRGWEAIKPCSYWLRWVGSGKRQNAKIIKAGKAKVKITRELNLAEEGFS